MEKVLPTLYTFTNVNKHRWLAEGTICDQNGDTPKWQHAKTATGGDWKMKINWKCSTWKMMYQIAKQRIWWDMYLTS